MTELDIKQLRELQQEIRRRMPSSSEGEIEAEIRRAIRCPDRFTRTPGERRRPPAPEYPTHFLETERKALQSDQ